jgi:hypothetical protein
MLEILESIKNLKIKNAAIYQKQISNNFKVEVLSIEDYEKWLSEQECK